MLRRVLLLGSRPSAGRPTAAPAHPLSLVSTSPAASSFSASSSSPPPAAFATSEFLASPATIDSLSPVFERYYEERASGEASARNNGQLWASLRQEQERAAALQLKVVALEKGLLKMESEVAQGATTTALAVAAAERDSNTRHAAMIASSVAKQVESTQREHERLRGQFVDKVEEIARVRAATAVADSETRLRTETLAMEADALREERDALAAAAAEQAAERERAKQQQPAAIGASQEERIVHALLDR